MADKTEEQPLDSPANTPPEDSSEEIAPIKETETTNPNQEIENMEVHHHAHHSGKKNWKSYFWEFLMLFLAVTLGFFVENQREHYIEHLRAKEFSKSLVQDLQNDTSAIHEERKSAKIYIDVADSMLDLSKNKLEGLTASRFSFYTRFMYWTAPIIWNRATFEQIKNSGSLRYFKNYHLLEKLMKYDVIVNEIEMESYNNQVRGNLLLKQINETIDPVYHHELSKHFLASLDTMSPGTMKSLYPVNPESMENKRNEVRQMLNMIVVQQRNLRRSIEIP
ncbi:MAG TPA: hypothetical protein VK498_04580 [Ferruginibacter sp.]|nr:hypothetical protein [Ferruginibacter sp.]